MDTSATKRTKSVLGRTKFDEAMDLIDTLSHSQSHDIGPQVVRDSHDTDGLKPCTDLSTQALLVVNLFKSGLGSDRLRLHLTNCADMSVTDLATLLDNAEGSISRGFIDGFLDRLCSADYPSSTQACRLPAMIWDMLNCHDTPTRTRFARLIQAVVTRKSQFVLVPLFVSERSWVMVVIHFSGVVCVYTQRSVTLHSGTIQAIRRLASIHLRVSVSSFEFKPLSEECAESEMAIVRSIVLLFHPDDDAKRHPLPSFSRALILFILGESTSIL